MLASCLVNAQQTKLKVMIIFAHPDEGEIYAGGTTALYTQLGHEVKFLSITNGDAGHFSMKPAALAKRRYKEAMKAKEILKLSDYEILDYHDGNLKNTIEIQKKVAKIINNWEADVVFTYYPAEGGHNDNMTAGWIVRDAIKYLNQINLPVFIYIRDYHTTSFSYIPDIAVIIDDVWEQKLASCAAHESQVLEANPYALGIMDQVKESKEKQREYLFSNTYPFSKPTYDIQKSLEKWYGKKRAKAAKYVEAFEIAEFGRQVNDSEINRLFPIPGKSLTISGTIDWLDTGIDVNEETAIEIEADGEIIWKMVGREICPPNGAMPYTRWGNKPLLDVGTGALIGKIGKDSEECFFIGHYQKIIPFTSGKLFIGINDDNTMDNDGEYRVWIYTSNRINR